MENSGNFAFDDFGKRDGMTPGKVADVFTNAAGTYDEVWASRNYRDHIYIAEGMADYFQADVRDSVRILDAAAGTGMLAEQLWARGFSQIDGLDPSTGMMTEAMKKGVYTDYYLEFMDGHTIKQLVTDSYNGLVAAAAFNTGLLPCAALLEMARLVKPATHDWGQQKWAKGIVAMWANEHEGGLICFGVPDARFTDVKEYNNRLEPLMQRIEQDGLWKLLDKKHYDDFYDDANPGNVFRYIVCASDVNVKQYV